MEPNLIHSPVPFHQAFLGSEPVSAHRAAGDGIDKTMEYLSIICRLKRRAISGKPVVGIKITQTRCTGGDIDIAIIFPVYIKSIVRCNAPVVQRIMFIPRDLD